MIIINEIVLNIDFNGHPFVILTIWIFLQGKKPIGLKKIAKNLLDYFIND